MDKARKLRRYSRKDYSQIVEFPVEIVGRDGVVRRYSFEDSIRLYQRRIASAAERYGDREVVAAEIRHCRRRIGQLRRSYFTRFGWAAVEAVHRAAPRVPGIHGELAAFLRRVFAAGPHPAETSELRWLAEDAHQQTWYLRFRDEDDPARAYLLYVFVLGEDEAGEAARAAFRRLRASLRAGGEGGEEADRVELLVAEHETADLAFLLTGREPVEAPAEPPPEESPEPPIPGEEAGPDPLHEGMILLRQGRREEALRMFAMAYEASHFRRAAYVGAAVVADQLGAWDEALVAARMGVHYFPTDALLRHQLALAHLRRGEADAAGVALEELRVLVGDALPVAILEGLLLIDQGRVRAGARLLARARERWRGTDPDLEHAARQVGAAVLAARAARWALAATALLVLAASAGNPWFVPVVAAGFLGSASVRPLEQRFYHRVLRQPGQSGLRLANPAALRQSGPGSEPAQ